MTMLFLSIIDVLGELESLELSIPEIILNLLIALLVSLWVLWIYKLSYQTTVYNKSFSMTLPISALVTTMVIMAVSTNVLLSLGMVGALSIVRFRTAIKNPLDTIFMFWAIGIGITVGANSSVLAIIGSIVIGLSILFVQTLEIFTTPYILIVSINGEYDEMLIMDEVKKIYAKYQVRNKSIEKDHTELTFEVRGKKGMEKHIDPLKTLPGVSQVLLLSYRGDYVL
ncbi:MAG: DUF4956 domain-containing protein [Candidatus Izemoplasmatales bacterium]|jgi:uncharacterized membrane protein YhiD involved in acid resistance|nr:DUF4956 domain-containing protein [Candidatus Izemoplasmatales bacterium]